MDDKQLSTNFWLSEFKYATPEPELLEILQEVRSEINSQIKITSGPRTIRQHIDIYYDLYGDDWLQHIPWGSRHLPAFNFGLRAVDFQSIKSDSSMWSGPMLAEVCISISHKKKIPIGIGVGEKFVHLDVDRDKLTKWVYQY